MLDFITVGIGGFIGACLRFSLTKLSDFLRFSYPMGTLMSNVLAGIAVGVIMGLEQQSFSISNKTKLFLSVGLLGGLSTFSAFSAETIKMFQNEKYWWAASNILLNVSLSLLGVVLGMLLVKAIIKKA